VTLKISIPKSLVQNLLWLIICSVQLLGCNSSANRSTKFQQYYVQGQQLYIKNCSNCHQKNGTGLGLVYPPVDKSDYMDQHFNEVICLMKYGTEGALLVNGKSYNKPMPGVPSLTELEIAEIATYIYNTWEHQRGTIDIKEVTNALKKCQQ
jgi:cytochrome c551